MSAQYEHTLEITLRRTWVADRPVFGREALNETIPFFEGWETVGTKLTAEPVTDTEKPKEH